jgi:hypothetical protein
MVTYTIHGTTVGEAMNATVDYAAKVGLAMIMVNCNLEQVLITLQQTFCTRSMHRVVVHASS